MSPQNPEQLSFFQEGSINSYVPMVDSTIVNHISWVAPQLYNDAVPFDDPVKYVKSLQAGHVIEWDGKKIEVRVPPSKIILGHPATEAAAPATRPLPWQNSTETGDSRTKDPFWGVNTSLLLSQDGKV